MFSLCNKHVRSLATSCPHTWQKHVLLANQNSKFWQLIIRPLWNFLAPLHKHLKWSKVDQQHVRAFCVWSFENQNKWNSCFWSAWISTYSTLHRKTQTHILPFGRCELRGFVPGIFNATALTGNSKREGCVFYLGRGLFKFFSFDVCFVTFRLFLLLSLHEPFTCAK